MLRTFAGVALLLAVAPATRGGAAYAQTPEQAERGRKVFAEKKCATCHVFEGQGTPVGPDLKNIAALSPRAIAIAVRATRTQSVISVKLKSGETFPAMRTTPGDKTLEVYDLSKDPPALRKFEAGEVDSTKDNESWKHPPASAEMPDDELADVIAYIRWIAVRDKKGVDPSEVR
jgi:mono/diheme cytochrome c family protein